MSVNFVGLVSDCFLFLFFFFFFQAEDGIRDLVRSRGLGDVYKRQLLISVSLGLVPRVNGSRLVALTSGRVLVLRRTWRHRSCVLLRAVAADERTLTVNKFSGLPLYLFANLPTRPYLTRRVAQRVNADRRRLSPVAT